MFLRDAFLKQLKTKTTSNRDSDRTEVFRPVWPAGNLWSLCFLIFPSSISTVLGMGLLLLPLTFVSKAWALAQWGCHNSNSCYTLTCLHLYTSKWSHNNTTNVTIFLGLEPCNTIPCIVSASYSTRVQSHCTLAARQSFCHSFSTFPLCCFHKAIIMGNLTVATKTSSKLVNWIAH